jgi:putative phosphoesterase
VWSGLKIVVISDIHSNLDAFQAITSQLPARDGLLCLGDIVGYGPQPNEVIQHLQAQNPEVVLMGNHDYAVVTGDVAGFTKHAADAIMWTRGQISHGNLNYLRGLLPSAKLQIDSTQIALFHGSPKDPLSEYVFPGISNSQARGLIREEGASVVLLGHTHMPMVYSFEEQMLANPGSVGQPRDGDPRASFGILDTSKNYLSFDIIRIRYDVEPVALKITEAGLPSFLAERLYSGI